MAERSWEIIKNIKIQDVEDGARRSEQNLHRLFPFLPSSCGIIDACRDKQVMNLYNKYLLLLQRIHGRASVGP
jgi:hypothetical protein